MSQQQQQTKLKPIQPQKFGNAITNYKLANNRVSSIDSNIKSLTKIVKGNAPKSTLPKLGKNQAYGATGTIPKSMRNTKNPAWVTAGANPNQRKSGINMTAPKISRTTANSTLPAYKKGGKVKKTGKAIVHKGEMVVPKKTIKKAGNPTFAQVQASVRRTMGH